MTPQITFEMHLKQMMQAFEHVPDELGGLLDAIQQRGAGGETLHLRLRQGGGWELRHPREQPRVSVTQADMDMAGKALAIGSDLRREWLLALLFAEHREEALKAGGAPA